MTSAGSVTVSGPLYSYCSPVHEYKLSSSHITQHQRRGMKTYPHMPRQISRTAGAKIQFVQGSSTFLEILIFGSNLSRFMCCRPILSLHRLNVLDRRNPMFSEGRSLRHKILKILLDLGSVYTTKMMTFIL